jgi:hypothetical protein
MPNPEFVSFIRETIRLQLEKTDLAVQEKLHSAVVVMTQGPKVWEELRNEIETTIREISLDIPKPCLATSSNESKITIQNNAANRVAVAEFEPRSANVNYSCDALNGTFVAYVHGNELAYSDRDALDQSGTGESLVQVTIAQMAEKLLSAAVMP